RRLHPPRPRGRVRPRRPSGDPRRGHAILPGPRASGRPSAAGDPNVLVGRRLPRVRGPLISATIAGVQRSADGTLIEYGVREGAAAIRRGGRRERAVSAVERKPAQLVAQPLVFEHKFPDRVGELGALPLALQAASRRALVFYRRRPPRPD